MSRTLTIHQACWPPVESFDEIIDVRSPGEFAEDHLPGAINLPVLDDQQRAEVGTLDRQTGSFEAKRTGAAYVSRSISEHLASHFADKPRDYRPLVYCWRGGQRSASLVMVLGSVGWRAVQLEGGYKAFRRHVVERLSVLPARFRWIAVNGLTGTAKTSILHHLAAAKSAPILDLEGLAHHKGSVLGPDPTRPQPTQKGFETAIWKVLEDVPEGAPILVESESRKVGNLHCPNALWEAMTSSEVVRIELPLDARVRYLLKDYHYFVENPDFLLTRVARLEDRYGKKRVAAWAQQIEAGDWDGFVASLLEEHYDVLYRASTRYPEPSWTLAFDDYNEAARRDLESWYEQVTG